MSLNNCKNHASLGGFAKKFANSLDNALFSASE